MTSGTTFQTVDVSKMHLCLANLGSLTRIRLIRKQMQIRRLDNSNNRREQRQPHHNAHAQLLRKPHLQIPKRADGHNRQHDIRHGRIRTNPVRVVVENRRIPACTRERGVPQLLRRRALQKHDKDGYHGEDDLDDGHGVEGVSAWRIWIEEIADEDCDGDVWETEGAWIFVRDVL